MIIEVYPDYIPSFENYNIYDSVFSNYMYLGVDQFRGAEILFKPYLTGVDQSGIIETISQSVKGFDYDDQRKLLENIFICGGNMNFNNIEKRIHNEIRSFTDTDINVKVNKAENPSLDSWNGARKFYNEDYNNQYFISKSEYEENGAEYFKWNPYSNLPKSK